MKTQLNLRKGPTKDGFRILKRFNSINEARQYLQDYVMSNAQYKPTDDPEVYVDPVTHTQIWISRQFTPSGYRYVKPTNEIKTI